MLKTLKNLKELSRSEISGTNQNPYLKLEQPSILSSTYKADCNGDKSIVLRWGVYHTYKIK
jgi:hypothetical protein